MQLLLFLLWPNVARKVGARSMQRWSGDLNTEANRCQENKSSKFEELTLGEDWVITAVSRRLCLVSGVTKSEHDRDEYILLYIIYI